MNAHTDIKTITARTLESWARTNAPLASAVLAARVFAEAERERVDALTDPIVLGYRFTPRADLVCPSVLARCSADGYIRHTRDLYLVGDESEPLLTACYADIDAAHRARGFTGPANHCPALIAENIHREAVNHLIDASSVLFGWTSADLHGDDRRKATDLLVGACVTSGFVTNLFHGPTRL